MTRMATDAEEVIHPVVPSPEEPFHPINTVAEMFGVKPSTVRGWISSGKIKGKKVLNRWHIPHSEVVRIANEEYGNE